MRPGHPLRYVLAVLVVAVFLYLNSRRTSIGVTGPYGVEVADGEELTSAEIEANKISLFDAIGQAVAVGFGALVMWAIVAGNRPRPEDEYRRGFREGAKTDARRHEGCRSVIGQPFTEFDRQACEAAWGRHLARAEDEELTEKSRDDSRRPRGRNENALLARRAEVEEFEGTKCRLGSRNRQGLVPDPLAMLNS